jgi:hypothetical protein
MRTNDEPSGLRTLRAGFCHRVEDDERFALGWPHLRRVVADPSPPEVVRSATRRALAFGQNAGRAEWSRAVATRLVRLRGLKAVFELAPGVRELRPEAEEALQDERDLSVSEFQSAVAVRMTEDLHGLPAGALEEWVLLAEALLGAEPVATAIVEVLEGLDGGEITASRSLPPQVTLTLGYVLLRVPTHAATALRHRMAGVLAAACGADLPAPVPSHARSLALVLHGTPAADMCTDRSPGWYTFATDAERIRERVRANRLPWFPDARLAFLAGTSVLPRFARQGLEIKSVERQQLLFSHVAPIAGPDAFAFVLTLCVRGPLRAQAVSWFAERGKEARAWLSGPAAPQPAAGQLLSALG